MMNVDEILKELDNLFISGNMEKVEAFLFEKYNEAVATGDGGAALTILNEQIGYYRVTTQYEKALETIENIRNIIIKMNISGTISEGTSLLNVATVYRAMGKYDEAKKCYKEAETIYKKNLDGNDYRMAGLYNNMSLFYQEINEYDKAIECLQKALCIISKIEDSKIQIAVTHTNMGQVYCRMEKWDQAMDELDEAEKLFIETDINDEHYSGCANAKGYLYMNLKVYDKAIEYYEKALAAVYQSYGKTANFYDIREQLMLAYKLNGDEQYESMMDVCEAFYEKYGKKMIHEKFGEYEDEIAVGLCGEGSECFFQEDEISLDHDCGPGFAMWVSDDVYDKIGEELNRAYNELPKVFAGYVRTNTVYGNERCGVCRIDDFFKRVLGGRNIPHSECDWNDIDESLLATAINGRVFCDAKGVFTAKRNILKGYYPHNVWIEKLSRELMYSAQTGQYNYGRAMARGEYVTASIVLSEYMKSIMHVVYLLNKTYSPYYKWQHRMVKKLDILPEIGSILEAICDMPSQRDAWKDYKYDGNPNPNDMVAGTIEIVAKLVVNALKEMGLSEISEPYLEVQGKEILKKRRKMMENMTADNKTEKETLIENIVKLEWIEFGQVQNEGGRASCQDNWETFSIMRKSQYMTWPEDMLNEYLWYLNESYRNGRNLITEKYGRMMESTSPLQYEQIKDSFPALSEKRKQIMEAIIEIQVKWMEEFAKDYSAVASTARSIHTSEDSEYNTSYETYLRGELGTYSEELIGMYGQFIVGLLNENKNLAYMTMENTVKLYGYDSIDDAERKIK